MVVVVAVADVVVLVVAVTVVAVAVVAVVVVSVVVGGQRFSPGTQSVAPTQAFPFLFVGVSTW